MHLYRLRLGVRPLVPFTCSLLVYHLRVACSFTAYVLVLLYRLCVGAGVGVGSPVDVFMRVGVCLCIRVEKPP